MKVGVLFRDETAWLTQRALAELFGVGVPAITKHLKNIFESGELARSATVSKMEMVQSEGDRRVVRALEIYNLDAIIAVGYRVNMDSTSHDRKRTGTHVFDETVYRVSSTATIGPSRQTACEQF